MSGDTVGLECGLVVAKNKLESGLLEKVGRHCETFFPGNASIF